MSNYEIWQLIMSLFTKTYKGRCVSYWTNPCFGSANSPRRAKVYFCVHPASMGRWEKLRRIYYVWDMEDKEEWSRESWCRQGEKGRGKGVPMGREAVSPWETSNALQPCDQPAPWLSADSSLTAPLRLLHTHIHRHTYIFLLATVRALTLIYALILQHI